MSVTSRRGGFAVLIGLAVASAGLAAVGVSKTVRVAARGCETSDLALTQTIGAGPVDTVSVLNNGPCGTRGFSITVTPSGGPLPALTSVHATPGGVKCSETATSLVCRGTGLGVGSTATVSLPVTVSVSYHAVALLTDADTVQTGVNDNQSWVTPLDPTTGGTVNQGSAGDNQIDSVQVPDVPNGQSPSASIQFAPFPCPAQFSEDCHGTPIHTTSPVTTPGSPTVTTLSFLASTIPPGDHPMIFWNDNPGTNAWLPVAACTGPGATPNPCIQSSGLVTIGGVSYLQYVLLSSFDNYWF